MPYARLAIPAELLWISRRLQSVLPKLKTRREAIRAAIAEIEENSRNAKLPFVDTHGRSHNYLRISLTEKCNLRCVYCMPEEGVTLSPTQKLLTADEIVRLVELFASHGVNKIRLTGGEPTIRSDLVDIVGKIRNVPGIEDIGITSNGIVLAKKLRDLKDAGLTKVNISLDTLDARKFVVMTRRNGFAKVMQCIDAAERLFPKVKVNTVVMRNVNDNEVADFVEMTKDRRLDIRFIEYMPFGGIHFSTKQFVDYKSLLNSLDDKYKGQIRRLTDSPNDTTKAYKIDGFVGQFGFITSMSDNFCGTCNRLRITADGNLKVCLHGNAEISMRDLLRSGASSSEISYVIQKAVERKKKQHAGFRNGKSATYAEQANDSHWRMSAVAPFSSIFQSSLRLFPSSHVTSSIRLCSKAADLNRLSHVTRNGSATQVDVSHKPITYREAVAEGKLQACSSLLNNSLKKGDVLATARIASVVAAKLTAQIIPLCHNITISYVNTEFRLDEKDSILYIRSVARTTANTGIEMEALTACSVAALTVYDMCKSVSQRMGYDALLQVSIEYIDLVAVSLTTNRLEGIGVPRCPTGLDRREEKPLVFKVIRWKEHEDATGFEDPIGGDTFQLRPLWIEGINCIYAKRTSLVSSFFTGDTRIHERTSGILEKMNIHTSSTLNAKTCSLLITFYFKLHHVSALYAEDPSMQELDMFEWSSGIRVAYCVDAPLPDILSPFRRTFSKVATKYCHNITACNLKKQLVFGPEHIMFVEGFPRREYGAIHIKFYVVFPHNTEAASKQRRPLLPRAVLSGKYTFFLFSYIISKHLSEISNRLGWSIISYEKYPRFDSMTEFMNIAIIPIVIFSVPLMIFLAYWTSSLRPNLSSDAWLVTGATGGKNAALRRTMEIIAEQNAEIDRQNRIELTKHMIITGGHEGITSTGQLLLNVARLSMASSQPAASVPVPQRSSPPRVSSPQIVVIPSGSDGSESSQRPLDASSPRESISTIPVPSLQLLSVGRGTTGRKHNRRQSSVEDVKQFRKARGSRSHSQAKPWKAGSLMLGGFSRRN
ncbi:hypothetical protein Q1695_001670 [Nippostrongylus brasiliensis]|nr:hypothetical protein Q1695_001670 [Nippostrongylus brasiliensis]